MINLSQETEALIQAKAARTGRTADEITMLPGAFAFNKHSDFPAPSAAHRARPLILPWA
jgi:hypothetical protein